MKILKFPDIFILFLTLLPNAQMQKIQNKLKQHPANNKTRNKVLTTERS